ncbi:hypothetical protein [Pukyongiella litopenaei]|uniref:Uncharacterized protein n=1 Tax=Pukyongiella litopenaei TaxID=2605946 RepID=A0A5C2H1V7_9RHOB|nr:hypothetical protein [Pukyongiella litopenaei]QEP30438.1 hypothetical protein C6Y53_19675 [Pukyongiella litopenaei]
MRDLTPVLLENGFRDAIRDGGTLEIHCVAEVEHNGNDVNGQWKFFVREEFDGQDVRSVLALQRNVQHRVIKTARGVVSLAAWFGATSVSLPLVRGGIGVCEVDQTRIKPGKA